MEIVLCATILVIGLIVGLTSARDAIVTELADFGGAIGSLNQSYSFASITIFAPDPGGGPPIPIITIAGSEFIDLLDDCDTSTPPNTNSRCVTLCTAADSCEET